MRLPRLEVAVRARVVVRAASILPPPLSGSLYYFNSTTPSAAPSSSGSNIGAIAAGTVGGVVGAALLLYAIWLVWKRRRREPDHLQSQSTDSLEKQVDPHLESQSAISCASTALPLPRVSLDGMTTSLAVTSVPKLPELQAKTDGTEALSIKIDQAIESISPSGVQPIPPSPRTPTPQTPQHLANNWNPPRESSPSRRTSLSPRPISESRTISLTKRPTDVPMILQPLPSMTHKREITLSAVQLEDARMGDDIPAAPLSAVRPATPPFPRIPPSPGSPQSIRTISSTSSAGYSSDSGSSVYASASPSPTPSMTAHSGLITPALSSHSLATPQRGHSLVTPSKHFPSRSVEILQA